MRYAVPWVFAAVLALGGVTAGCGQGEDRPGIVTSDNDERTTTSGSTTTTTTTSTTPGPTRDP